MPRRYCWFSTVTSTSRMTVKRPSTNTAGSTEAMKGAKAAGDWTAKPIATSELDRARM
jgi:hypothetical protein